MNPSTLSPKFIYKNKMLTSGDHYKRCFTEIIQEDDNLFYNIQVKGRSLDNQTHLDSNKSKGHLSFQQTLKNSLVKSKQQNSLITKWVLSTSKFIGNDSKKQQSPLKRSITVQSVYNTKKNVAKKRSIHSAIKRLQQKNQNKSLIENPSFVRCEKVNKETSGNFKNIIEQFNKVRQQIKQKEAEQGQQKRQDKTMRIFYKKPNFYEYQQFYRQNYQSKSLKQDIFLFKKISYMPSKNSQDKVEKQTKIVRPEQQKKKFQQSQKNQKKKTGVYVHVEPENSQKKSPQKQEKSMGPFITLEPYLNIKSHQFSKTSRNSVVKRKLNVVSCMNKTFSEYKKAPVFMENQKIQPWISLESCDNEQNRLHNIF